MTTGKGDTDGRRPTEDHGRGRACERQPTDRVATVQVSIVDAAGKALPAVIPVRADMLDGQGNPAEFCGHYGAANGAVSVRLDLGPNDAAGMWTVRARELASGMTAEAKFADQR